MPRSLDLDRLRKFEPVADAETPVKTTAAVRPVSEPERVPEPRRWPSREPVRDGQISIKAPLDVIDRFRVLCRDDRRTYADMLEILMDGHESKR